MTEDNKDTKAETVAESADATSPKEESSNSKSVSLGGRGGILGLKAGMTHVYDEEGHLIPVTVIDFKPNVITQIKTKEKDGYTAVQVGLMERKKTGIKSELGHIKNVSKTGFSHYQEFRTDKVDGITVGQVLSLDFLKPGDRVDVSATTKGKGFQGVMKRHNFGGGPKTHGASLVHRAGGSIGNRATPGRVFKNRKMAGHMGHQKFTVQNLEVISVDNVNNLLAVRGAVPGSKSGVLTVRKAVKA